MRHQLFEFNDQAWVPAALRESIVESLSLGIRIGRFMSGVTPVFRGFLDEARSDSILDLCSGAGGPIIALLEAIRADGAPVPDVLMCDLFPNVAALERARSNFPSRVAFVRDPIDATRVPEHLWRPVRVIVNALHHFPRPLVRAIIEDCVRARASLFVLEVLPRDFFRGLRALPPLAVASLLNPLVAPARRGPKALATYAVPLVQAMGLFDLVVSISRIHDGAELMAIGREVAPGSYRWAHGTAPYPLGGRASFFYGVPLR